ncbi:MAG: hypothetical protein ACKOEE_09205 [Tagaea sp.]|jgi:hypothetical protein|nr:hypothetical protein [Azospirillum sp.]MCA3267777.1 hypothetical protein [Azospirillum sp.]MCZ8122641.1 hypothetical protein [Magnetospirillum sp.]
MKKTLAAALAFSLVAPAIAFAQATPATPATPAAPHAQAPAAPVKKDEAKKNEVRRDAAPGQTQKRN